LHGSEGAGEFEQEAVTRGLDLPPTMPWQESTRHAPMLLQRLQLECLVALGEGAVVTLLVAVAPSLAHRRPIST